MPGRTSGLERDLNLVRRRAWLFIPFFVLGVLAALAFGSFAGQANAVAAMQIETVVNEVLIGGDRGFRIFEAQAMTGDEEFRKKVIAATGDPNFDYARFSISLAPISVADGVSRGVLTISIQDVDKVKAEQYRQAFVDVYGQEFAGKDGLFRRRFIATRQRVLDDTQASYNAAIKRVQDAAKGKNLPLDQLVVNDRQQLQEYNRQEADLQRNLAEVKSALDAVSSGRYTPEANLALAASVLKTPVTGDPRSALSARQASFEGALAAILQQRLAISDISFDPALLAALDSARGARDNKLAASQRLENARVAVASAESTISTSYSFSGGVAGTLLGRIAIVVAVTVVFGLIAIYALEWLLQVRAGTHD